MSSEPSAVEKEALGVYLHIPFCVSHCTYCDFYTKNYAGPEPSKQFAETLAREIDLSARELGVRGRRVDTLYFGGGTPSLLEPRDLGRLMGSVRASFSLDSDAEISLEANPENVSEEKISAFLNEGVNRFSFGVQTFQSATLLLLGRAHDREQACRAVQAGRRAGGSNLSLDLMLSLPGQSLATLEEDLTTLVELAPDHVSAYLLEMDKETALRQRIEKGEVAAPSEGEAADLYEFTMDRLAKFGYRQYEISSFARENRECLHNLKYWRDRPFFGGGPSAWSYLSGSRSRVTRDLDGYLAAVGRGEPPARETDRRPQSERMDEAIFAGLRLLEGVDLRQLARRYRVKDPLEHRREELAAVLEAGLIELSGDRLRLTRRGLPVANEVFQVFV